MAFALALKSPVTEVRQMFFTTTCVITIATVIINGGMTVPVLSFLEVELPFIHLYYKDTFAYFLTGNTVWLQASFSRQVDYFWHF